MCKLELASTFLSSLVADATPRLPKQESSHVEARIRRSFERARAPAQGGRENDKNTSSGPQHRITNVKVLCK